jgi:ArsR family transcriptional regulator
MQYNAYSGNQLLNEHRYRQAAQAFHLLSHQGRLHILDELRRDEACVCHLQAVLHRPQAYVSQQLRVLREAGIVTDRKDGLLVYYRIIDPQTQHLLEEVLGPPGEPSRLPACSCPKCNSNGQEGV